MGAPPQSLLDSLNVKGMVLHKKGTSSVSCSNPSNLNGSLWNNLLETQRAKLSQTIIRRRSSQSIRRNRRVFVMKRKGRMVRREGAAGSSRSSNGIERRVRTLKRLVPTRESEGLDGLFRDTAAYIMSLQMRVRVMQIMVDVLDASQDHQ